METHGLPPTALLLVLLAALSILAVSDVSASSAAEAVTGRCDAPYKTLSSDCRDAQYGANFLCVVNDQRAGQPSPCTTGPANKAMECAIRSGLSCDLLAYKINYTPTQARFHIKFQGDASPVAPPIAPPRPPSVGGLRLLATGGSGSGDGPKTPHPIRADVTPSPRPRTPPPAPVDPTVAPVTTVPTRPSATRVDTLPPQPPDPISPARPPVDPTVAPVTIAPPTPSTPSSTRVDTLPPQPPTPIAPAPGPVVPIDYNGNNVIPSESNEFVDAIGVLRLDHALTELYVLSLAFTSVLRPIVRVTNY
jgi:hypothetical protein